MMDLISPELVETVVAERSKEAESTRLAAEAGKRRHAPRLRSRLALLLGGLAACIHPEAARHAVALRAAASAGHKRLCFCED